MKKVNEDGVKLLFISKLYLFIMPLRDKRKDIIFTKDVYALLYSHLAGQRRAGCTH